MSSGPSVFVEEVFAHKGGLVIDASWINGPFNQGGIDVRARYCQAHIPGAWFLRSFARAWPPRDVRIDAITRPPRQGVREPLAKAAPCTSIVRSPEVVQETPHGQRFRQPAQLAALLAERHMNFYAGKIATCYFGGGAAVVATAIKIAGWGFARVNAGSLIEYAQAQRSG